MIKPHTPEIRRLLRENPDGLKITELQYMVPAMKKTIANCLARMPDTYIDRWVPVRGQWAAVWCVVVPPTHCPKPERKANYD